MSRSRSQWGADSAILTAVIDGHPWVARSLHNPEFRKQIRALGRVFGRSPTSTVHLRDPTRRLCLALLEQGNLLTMKHSLSSELVPALLRISAYAHQWVRSPETWQPAKELDAPGIWKDLINHLFTSWSVPGFFYSAWLVRGELRCIERDWFCQVAQGRSWKKSANFSKEMTSKAIHLAMGAPEHLTVLQALRLGQLRSLSATEELIHAVLSSAMVSDISNDAVWLPLFRKVIASKGFDVRDFGVLSDLLLDLNRSGNWRRSIQLIKLPLRELRAHCYRRWMDWLKLASDDGVKYRNCDLHRPGLRFDLLHFARARWESMDGVEPFEISVGSEGGRMTLWTIEERCSHGQLLAEGKRMRHCVGGYRRKCEAGYSAIFSLTARDKEEFAPEEPRLTIEVDRSSRKIIQARGRWNSRPQGIEYRILDLWAARNDMRLMV